MRRRWYAAVSVGWLLLVGAAARAELVQTLFRADDGTAFQVLRAAATVRITSVAGSLAGTASCASAGDTAGAPASAVGHSTFAATLHPYALVRRSFVLAPNDIGALSFAADGSGRVTLGSGAGALAVCASPFDCTGVANLQPLAALDSNLGNVPPACTAAGLAAACDLGNSGDAFAFGLPAHGPAFICDDPAQVTVDTSVCAPPPADGFDLPAGRALVLVYGGDLQASSFAIAVGGFDVGAAAPPLDCPAGTIAGAVADSEDEPPPPTATATPAPPPTRPAVPVVASPLAPSGLFLVATLGVAVILAARSRSVFRTPTR